ncbi:MAG: deoxyribose-phosphate aldolase [Fimbriimonas sp.]|nr:deoxyribose-phosphate aldolase [Fimbriimonas sp.]
MSSLDIKTITKHQLAKTIDHSLLQPQLTDDDVKAGCAIALKYDVASVCVKPYHVTLACEILRGSEVAVSTVIGFPHGGSTTTTKVFEASEAASLGAVELDMVINIGKLRSGEVDYVREEIRQIVEAGKGALIKVILENAYLDQDQKVAGYHAVESAGAQFVKTSTGFAPTGATLEDLRLMRATVGPEVQVKAAHGVRTLEALLDVIDAGATRVGATATAAMLDAFEARQAKGAL